MKDAFVQLVSSMPHELGVILLSMIPVAELRLAIPLAITQYGLPPLETFLFSCIGNLIPVPFIVLFIRKIFNWMKKFRIFRKIVEKLEERGNSKRETVEKYKFWGLFIFVAIPLPGTGAWTGALIAGLMDMRLKKALPSIALGVLAAGIIVTLMTTGVLKVFGL